MTISTWIWAWQWLQQHTPEKRSPAAAVSIQWNIYFQITNKKIKNGKTTADTNPGLGNVWCTGNCGVCGDKVNVLSQRYGIITNSRHLNYLKPKKEQTGAGTGVANNSNGGSVPSVRQKKSSSPLVSKEQNNNVTFKQRAEFKHEPLRTAAATWKQRPGLWSGPHTCRTCSSVHRHTARSPRHNMAAAGGGHSAVTEQQRLTLVKWSGVKWWPRWCGAGPRCAWRLARGRRVNV